MHYIDFRPEFYSREAPNSLILLHLTMFWEYEVLSYIYNFDVFKASVKPTTAFPKPSNQSK